MKTYEIGERSGARFIRCLVCKMESFNQNDIEHRRCGFCHQFHDVTEAAGGLQKVWISQWLCERRHCAIAIMWDPKATNARAVQDSGEKVFKSDALNRRCGICGGDLQVEHRPTIWSTMDEARKIEAANLASRELIDKERAKKN